MAIDVHLWQAFPQELTAIKFQFESNEAVHTRFNLRMLYDACRISNIVSVCVCVYMARSNTLHVVR